MITHDEVKACALRLIHGQRNYVEADHRLILDYIEDQRPKEPLPDPLVLTAANKLAWGFYAILGYIAPDGWRFDRATRKREQQCWTLAKEAFEQLRDTDLTNLEDWP